MLVLIMEYLLVHLLVVLFMWVESLQLQCEDLDFGMDLLGSILVLLLIVEHRFLLLQLWVILLKYKFISFFWKHFNLLLGSNLYIGGDFTIQSLNIAYSAIWNGNTWNS